MEFGVHCWVWCTALLHTGETLKVLGEYDYGRASHRQIRRSSSFEDGSSRRCERIQPFSSRYQSKPLTVYASSPHSQAS
jgi:hypothetical protein